MLYVKSIFVWTAAVIICAIASSNMDKVSFMNMVGYYSLMFALIYAGYKVMKNASKEEIDFMTLNKFYKKYLKMDLTEE